MGSVTWHFSDFVAAKPDDVWAWMTDFTNDDHSSAAFKRGAGIKDDGKPAKASKRVITKQSANVLLIEDSWGRSSYKQTVTLDPATRSYRIQSGFGYDSTWHATPEGDGTRFEVEGKMGTGLIGSIMGLFAGATRKSMGSDFRGHLEDLRESLKAQKPA